MEELEGSNDDRNHQQIVIRGKRTKRHRPASPFGFSVACSSSAGGGGDESGSNSSPTTSGGGGEVWESTEEEEDMANCLILLAQGRGGKKVVEASGSSRKFTEVAASSAASGKIGFYVYECKTCNRRFPSFQALGGHRASHKKPKTAPSPPSEATASVSIPILQSSTVTTDHEQDQSINAVKINGQSSLQFENRNNKSNKIHECSICGAEFTSGQALGGHMRRHRAAATSATTVRAAASTVTSADEDQEKRGRNILLDLNLPAPEDEQRESTSSSTKFEFASAKQSIVFSAPALIHCHY